MAKGRFGIHGGQYIPETPMNAILELESAYDKLPCAKIYLKREDLNHTGSHKINNVLGQALNVYRMELLGAMVNCVTTGTETLKDKGRTS